MRDKDIQWERIQSQLLAAMNRLPRIVGIKMVEFYKMRFRDQAWKDVDYRPWEQRKDASKKGNRRAILRKSGRLARSPRITNYTNSSVTVGTDVPYAQVHNEGFNGTVNVAGHTRRKIARSRVYNITTRKGHSVTSTLGEFYVKPHQRKMNMPQRQFIGYSTYLNEQIERIIYTELKRSLNL